MNSSNGVQLEANVGTCWNLFSPYVEGRKTSAVAAVAVLLVVTALNVVANGWCAFVMLTTPKLQKPTWLFK